MKKALSKQDIFGILKKFSLVVLGTLVLSFGCAVFIIPFDLVAGGATGLAIVINSILPEGLVPIDITVGIVTWVLFFIGLFTLGRDFAMKTLLSTIIYPLGISLFMNLTSPELLDGFFRLTDHGSDLALLIGALFGGLCVGTGCALTFIGGGSTGGVDIIAFVLCKIFKSWKSSVVIFIIDASIILLGMFVIKDFVITLLGIISAFIAAIVIDRIFLGQSQAFTADIVSDKYEEINEQIINDIKRTSTILEATGGYSKSGKKLLRVTFSMRQYADLMNVIRKTDKQAFVSITRAHEINGEGWTYGQHDS
ncbi:MAG: YitT family protein [Clostridia bacterium]|nr:YitT family protein [Clostridia bacterium]